MDVTFFENQPYYPKPSLWGESFREEDWFWEVLLVTILENCTPIGPTILNPILDFEIPNREDHVREEDLKIGPGKQAKIKVYSRKNKGANNSPHCQFLEQNIKNLDNTCKSQDSPSFPKFLSSESIYESSFNLNIPIALRKGVRTST